MSDEHRHEHQHHDWRAAITQMRDAARHHFEHRFDWRGHPPPPEFDGPRYFDLSEAWRVPAWLDRDAPGTADHVTLPTSTGKLRDMTIAGQLVFEAARQEQRLTAYLPAAHADGEQWLFVPFRDATSGGSTYGSGRYLDLPYEADETDYLLDFNLAYNPSCAYSPAYDCPFPPPGNRLSVAVEAGEMVPFEQHLPEPS